MELDDTFHIWKIKLQLALQGNFQALEDIKSQSTCSNPQFAFIENNLHDALKNANIRFFKQGQSYGNYELYSQLPLFLVLSGQVSVKCLNLQGDEEQIAKIQQKSVVNITKQKIVSKFGQGNMNIITKFSLAFLKDSIIIEINDESRRKILAGEKEMTSLVGLREESIMKKYMLFPLKYIRIQDYELTKLSGCQEKFYLLEGRACYYLQKGKQRIILTVYEQGYINPKQFTNSQIHLYVFQKSKILIFQQEFMRDDVVAAVQSKRNHHIQTIIKGYENMAVEQKKKIQLKLINNFKLNKKQIDKAIYGIVQSVAKQKEKQQTSKRISTKNDLISTSSSIKERCKIRISKKKKIA